MKVKVTDDSYCELSPERVARNDRTMRPLADA